MIVLEISKADTEFVCEDINVLKENGAIEISTKAFQGAPETLQLLVNLSPILVSSVTCIIVTLLKSKKHVSIKHDGFEVSGISEKNAMKILNQLMEKEAKKNKEKESNDLKITEKEK